MPRTTLVALLAVSLLTMLAQPTRAQQPLEIFDAHLHYNWEPKPYLTLDQVLATFKRNNVTGIIATSRPNAGTHALVEARAPGLQVVPFIRPYRVRADIGSWNNDPSIYSLIEEEYPKQIGWRGIGEFHLNGRAAATEWVKKAVDFAISRDLYLHAHADEAAVELLYAHNDKARIVWAHTGFSLAPERVAALLDKRPTLWGELSYRSGIADSSGKLTPEWKALFERYSDRFVLGSDTWINERWASYDSIMAGYRQWLAQLSQPVAAKIAHRNARALFAARSPAVR